MHIPDGFLSPEIAGATAVVSTAAVGYGLKTANATIDERRVPLLGVTGAHAHGLDEYPQTSLARGALGEALLAGGDLMRAAEHLEQAVALARRGEEGCDIALAQVSLARLRLHQGDYAAARAALDAPRSTLEVAGLPRIMRLDRELSRQLGDPALEPGGADG